MRDGNSNCDRANARRTSRRELLVASARGLGGIAFGSQLLTRASARAKVPKWTGRKILIVYHSRTGHTRTIASLIAKQAGGRLFEIEPLQPYPEDYDALVAQNVREQQSDYLPLLKAMVSDIRDYDPIFVGSPLWNVRLTPPVRSFLARHDLSGKSIAPFDTYIVSGLGRSHEDIEELCPGSTILPGLAILGENASEASGRVSTWVDRLSRA